MVRFADIYFLYGLLLVPLFIILFWMMVRWKKKALRLFGETSIISQLIPDVSKSKPVFKFIVLMLAYVFLIFGLANPQVGSKLVEVKRKGVDLMLALDVSNSMLAQDIKPNRLKRAKNAISKLIDMLDGDRIGIIVFAGKAYTQLPITTDYGAAKLFLSTINTGYIPVQGTAIGSAIELAESSFDFSDNEKQKNKAIVIISDGENHEDDAVATAKAASEKGIVVHTIGMGSPEGAPIPTSERNFNNRFKKDKEGGTVVTKLNEIMLQQIAAASNGTYVRASNSDVGLKKIFKEINKMEQQEYESKTFSDYEDRFQYFIAVCLILLLLEFLIFEKKSKWFSKINLYGKQSK